MSYLRGTLSMQSGCKSLVIPALLVLGISLVIDPTTGVAYADGMDWDAVAQCESGGNWRADTGNGFYGGLQFKQSTWDENGGMGNPAFASRDQQIPVDNPGVAPEGPE